MKRRNVDCVKPRRPLKRTKIGEGIYGSSFVYVKFLIVWLLVIAADFLFEFRFEYLWPFWLFLRSVYDSFRYQGLAFSILFVCMALTSDMICLLFIPVNWLFFAASTYVWVQFVWHTEKGVCMPSVILWALFIYIEALVRLKDVKNAPFHLDLCRPFAAHCIGYPVVTLGFGLRSYVGFRLRQRRQREVAKENEFYVQLLQEALPPELQSSSRDKSSKDKAEEITLNGDIEIPNSANHTGSTHSLSNCNGSISSNHSNHSDGGSRSRGSKGRTESKVAEHFNYKKDDISPPPSSTRIDHNKQRVPNGSLHMELEYMQKKCWASSKSVNDYDELEAEKDKNVKSLSSSQSSSTSSTSSHGGGGGSSALSNSVDNEKKKANSSSNSSQANGSTKLPVSHTNNLKESISANSSRDKKNKIKEKENNKDSSQIPKEESVSIIRLEADIKRLKADLQSSRQTEQELRNQINTLLSGEKMSQQEVDQLQQDNDNLQNKLHNLVTARQNDRTTISNLERRLQEERRARQTSESQVSQLERRCKKLEEQSQARAQALANAKGECSESCRNRRGEIEGEVKRLRRENRSNEERFRGLERENLTLRQYKDSQSETEVLMSALSAMQDKNTHLESSLSSETKVKLDLFSALGEAKRQLEISRNMILGKDKEIEDLKSKITEVLALCPPTSSFPGNPLDISRYHYSSKILPQMSPPLDANTSMMLGDGGMMDGSLDALVGLSLSRSSLMNSPNMNNSHPQQSNLDPNARVYTPKGIDS